MLFAAGLLFWSGLSAFLPTLPLYIEETGATKQQIGIVMGSFAVGMLLFRPQFGFLADRQGRKIVLLIGMVVAAIAPLGYLFAKSIIPLMAVRAFHGISIAAFATGYTALAADFSPEHRRGEIMGYMSLTTPIGTAIGPAIGGLLHASYGYTALFLSCAASASLGFLCLFPVVNPVINKPPQNEIDNRFWQLLLSPRVRVPAIVLFLMGLSLGSVHTFISLFIKSTGVDFNGGLFFTAAAIASFGVRLFTGRASDKYGRGLFVTLSLIVYTLAVACIYLATTPAQFFLGGFMEGAAAGSIFPTMSAMMADRALPHERGKVFGISLMGFDIGLVGAGPIFGAVAETIGYRSMFSVAIALTTIATIVFLTQSSKSLTTSLRFALGRGIDGYALK
ncbi:MFS transporter [Richelia sinica FACHB-800]|nr:MFS transporter [Richelia sinica FACHB-800]